MIQEGRLHRLNDEPTRSDGKFVLYWMQASQRTRWNHALEYAIREANAAGLPLIVGFALMDDFPEANERHYAFLLDGLRDIDAGLGKRGIKLIVRRGEAIPVITKLAKEASFVVCDRGYTRFQKAWRDGVADKAGCRVMEVEANAVVPVEIASPKQEFAARTIRPKLHKHWPEYFVEVSETKPKHPSLSLKIAGDIDITDPVKALAKLKLDRSVKPTAFFIGGEVEAGKRLKEFIAHKLDGYAEGRNEPSTSQSTAMSSYLHYGHVSPLEMALAVRDAKAPQVDRDSFVEELCVRRELAINFTHYSPKYDSYDGLPEWARKTLSEHRRDPRYHVYSREQLQAADTHDPYWNAAQMQMNKTGFMHNYMRMYWGKKVLEWGKSPEIAYEDLLYLNNKLFLCGRDPNGWASVGWIFGLHDRPWGPERPVYGLIRFMNAAGLERKFDIKAYVKKVEEM